MNSLKSAFKKTWIGTFARQVFGKKIQDKLSERIFPGSATYWEKRYISKKNSGAGSYGRLADFKAEVLNKFVADNLVETVIEYGVGDGNQLSLAKYPNYIGFDVSQTAINLCNECFGGDNFIRSHVVSKIGIIMPSFNFVSAIHPSVILGKNVAIGAGSLLMAGVIVNNDSVIGTHCFLATKASLDHDSILGNYSSLSPGVTTGGSVTIGQCSAIGLGANILHGMDIGNHALVGAGALVRSILRTMLSLLVFLRKRNVKQERSIYS